MPISEPLKQALWIIVPLILVFGAEPLYRANLYQKSLDDIPVIQQNQTKKNSIKGFMLLVTHLGEIWPPLAMILVVYNLVPKVSAAYIWTSLAFIAIANGQLKSFYAEPRPFWKSVDINPAQCRSGFGNPSGHSMCTSYFWVTLLLHKYYEVGAQVRMRSIFCTAYIIKMALISVLTIFLIFVAFSRVYLGEHSFNEVVFGLSLGITLAFLTHFFVKPHFKRVPSILKSMAGPNERYHLPTHYFIITFMAVFVLPMIIFYGVWSFNSQRAVPTPEYDQRIKQFCTNKTFVETTSKYNVELLQSGIVGMAAGAILGQMYEMKYIKTVISNARWNKTSIQVTVLRTILTGLIFVLCELPYFLISDDQPESELLFLWMFKFCLPVFFSTFALFAFGKTIFYMLHLVNEQAIGREKDDDSDSEVEQEQKRIRKKGGNSLDYTEMEMAQKV